MPAVQLKLRLADTAVRHAAARSGLAAEMRPHSGKPGHDVLKSCVLHLKPRLPGPRLLRENTQDKPCSVYYFHIKNPPQIPELHR